MAEHFVRVETTSGVLQAEIIRSLLESRGISPRLSHESVATIYGLGVGPLAEVEILVPEPQVEIALRILDDYHAGRLIETKSEKGDD